MSHSSAEPTKVENWPPKRASGDPRWREIRRKRGFNCCPKEGPVSQRSLKGIYSPKQFVYTSCQIFSHIFTKYLSNLPLSLFSTLLDLCVCVWTHKEMVFTVMVSSSSQPHSFRPLLPQVQVRDNKTSIGGETGGTVCVQSKCRKKATLTGTWGGPPRVTVVVASC